MIIRVEYRRKREFIPVPQENWTYEDLIQKGISIDFVVFFR